VIDIDTNVLKRSYFTNTKEVKVSNDIINNNAVKLINKLHVYYLLY